MNVELGSDRKDSIIGTTEETTTIEEEIITMEVTGQQWKKQQEPRVWSAQATAQQRFHGKKEVTLNSFKCLKLN